MKRIVLFLMVLQAVVSDAKHQLVTIFNESDLTFEYAYHKKNGKEVRLHALSKTLQDSSLASKKHVFVDQYKIEDLKGLFIKISNGKGYSVDIFLDDQATPTLAFNRKKAKKNVDFPKGCKISDADYCARGIMMTADQKELASTFLGHPEGDLLNLYIKGSLGNYQLFYEHSV